MSWFDQKTSFDDERQLVRTSVGVDYQMSAENQPDYGSFMYEIREADNDSENVIEFCCKTSNIICNSLVVTVCVGLSIAIPVAMISIGVKNLEDCPKEPRIPVYLLVGGCFGMIKLLSTLWRNIQIRRYEDMDTEFGDSDSDEAFANKTYRTMDTLLFLFLVGWQIVGTYWTLTIWTPSFKQTLHEPSNWCDKTVYYFTVSQLCGSYIVMIVYAMFLGVLVCTQRCCYR
ncbi:transmembrane protein 272-like isoform X2 [Ruditapes philippinarum]|uniref:transmembrane protein 272-like isoform X2 n=1 Tax=Ruditapes philippinarum TaxID=129788 RepID=UPI00295B9A56|nr:transmembrane protein 272-like isoform X2 [Ruditapes philippinarum]